MAEIAAILALFFAGATALMNGASAYHQYRANHPRRLRDNRHKTGKSGGERPDYTAHHRGMSMRSGDKRRARPYLLLIQAPNITNSSCTPTRSVSRVAGPSQRSDPHLLQVPNITNGSCTPIGSVSRVAGPSQQLAVRNSNLQLTHSATEEERRLRNSFGGVILLPPEQQARDTHKDTSNYGVSTGARPRGSSKSSEVRAMASVEAHWKSLKSSHYGVNTADARAVAVVHWTHSNVTIFVEKHKTYYRNYKVMSCPDVAGFGLKYQRHEVFSGVIVDGKLDRCNHDNTLVEDDGECVFQSSNCWTKLGLCAAGIEGEVAQDPMFVEMVRGAVFGLICCVHKKPSSMNVDMRYGNGVGFVHVDTDVGG